MAFKNTLEKKIHANGLLKPISSTLADAIQDATTFIPSIFSATKSATTTVTGQSEAFAQGTTKLQIINNDATNYVKIAFGTSTTDAEMNITTGTSGKNLFIILPKAVAILVIQNYTHYAWVGNTGTVSIQAVQGV